MKYVVEKVYGDAGQYQEDSIPPFFMTNEGHSDSYSNPLVGALS